ncbi:MAG: DUF1549 and DUF1553 domain-containing protein, partial [Bryobacteraceae bacterium]|nr:DUF1549 and DUF1553 domain-containing protein [Bryobacteraceae bacterium]
AAYENLVDRLLASPHFGERWARHWLDLARYSDAGFNNVRFPYSFTYRDWVIGAFNADMPYDSFVKRQLAADLYSERQHLPALGLLSLGHNPPRASLVPDKIDDRIDVVSRTLLGLTVSCARCHDHKYDPIPTKDYYSLYGVFLNSFEPLVPASVDSASGPLDRFYLPRLQERLQTIEDYRKRRTEEISREMGEPETAAKYLQAAWDARSLTNPQAENLAKERNINLYVFKRWRKWAESAGASRPDITAALAAMAGQADAPYRIPLADFGHVMTEGDSNTVNNLRWHWDRLYTDFAQRGSARRAMAVADRETIEPSFVFVRGNMNDLGEQVPRRFLSILGGREFHHGSGRKELAEAIADPGNPLTARVMANRVWQHLFGEGLVRTTSDFGIRGDAPTHPELLDDLAAAFISGGWSVKKLIRRIVLSKTYRQSSGDVAAARLKDPENKLLWRMNRRRLDFDAARDTILAAGGGIDRTIGGPSFSLYSQPAESRRTLYAFVERERAQMLMKSFDYADPEQHTAQRHLTTVPQQALFLLNSTFAGEQARLLAARAGRDVTRLYRLALQRDPQARELELADRFLAASKPEAQAQTPPGVWSYGWGSPAAFTPFRYFSDDAWQASSLPPDREAGAAKLTASGGIPGDDTAHAV